MACGAIGFTPYGQKMGSNHSLVIVAGMTSKSECNNEVTGPQGDVSEMYPRNTLRAASNRKSHVLRQIEYFYHTSKASPPPIPLPDDRLDGP
jgi:hypothetical protein